MATVVGVNDVSDSETGPEIDSEIRVLIVDDDPLVRSALSMILGGTEDIRVVGEAEDGRQVPEAVARHRPDVLLMDIGMPGMDGIAATAALRRTQRPPKVVMLTTFDNDDQVMRALQSGAVGYLLKSTSPPELVRAVRLVAAGEGILSPAVTRQLIGRLADRGDAARREEALEKLRALTERELEVFTSIGQGKSNAEVAEELHMSPATVKAHVSRILVKLDLSNRVQVALLARDAELL
jgi:DNA-binding NarL/FixJ family response regulator